MMGWGGGTTIGAGLTTVLTPILALTGGSGAGIGDLISWNTGGDLTEAA